ncbi:5-Hydroxyisourate Hydrolase (HIUase) [Caenispirillum salinarum AK4]|uniref:5-Hydroxyisourate Hydrolase (HIUase) n=1 Tax=Caenispirillum salinarum AK4 TaxID=1238182 RepID=K9HDX3_9PROT|nr:2-oxo-4-hydroxy-4-carboxy-5-ureidoimidazoline decarboxylase [Caenispirillum salinarum]EKV28673.1 5-Hydroxyisourate Hydrolase (HIUase) [Caenispirillum salinarum AK4]
MTDLLSLDAVAAMDDATFVETFGDLFEHSPWVAERVARARPFASVTEMHDMMMGAVEAAEDDEKLSLLRAHPDLAGKAALAGELTHASTGEQASAGLDTLTPEEMERFTELNTAYSMRFGFPFIMAVKGADKARILAGFEGRLGNARTDEMQRALAEVGKIAWLRLLDRVAPAPTGKLTTHVLDTAAGRPANGLPVTLHRLDGERRTEVGRFVTNDDGRLDAPALQGADFTAGTYEWVFECGVYFARTGTETHAPPFLDRVPLRFGISNPEAHYHVPLLLSPWALSTYRGS